jgi:hypothetical protein
MKYRSRTISLVLSLSIAAVLLMGSATPHYAAMATYIPELQAPDLIPLGDSSPPLPTDGKEKADDLDSGIELPHQQGDPKTDEFTIPKSDLSTEGVRHLVSPRDLSGEGSSIQAPAMPDGWTTIMSEDFEGTFYAPGMEGWDAFDLDGAINGEYYWDDVSYRGHNGGWSAWPADAGADGITPPANYPNNMNSWLVYGPFDLSDAADAQVEFFKWLACEVNFDWFYFGVSDDGTNFTGVFWDGFPDGWISHTISFPGWVGDETVWIAFVFSSDASITYEGVYVDDIYLRKYIPPNLKPDTPSGGEYPIVPSSLTGTNTVETLYTYLNTYIDWAVTNTGSGNVDINSSSCLYFDGSQIQCWITPSLLPGEVFTVSDWILNLSPTAGWHNLEMVIDVNDDILESDETDNTWSMDFYWHPNANLTPYKPGGWAYPIVPSTLTGTNILNDLYVNMNTFIDWAVINSGPENILAQFDTCLYFDSAEVYCWYTDGKIAGNIVYIEDWILNLTPSPGWHNLKIITDVNDDVAESDETDNIWAADFLWNPSLNADIYLSPSSLTSQQTQDQVQTFKLEVRNYGSAPLDWSLYEAPTGSCSATDIPWVSVSPDTGTTASSSTTTVDVVLDSTGLTIGTYQAVLCASSNDPDEPLISVPITLEIIEELTIFLPMLFKP